MFRHCTYLLDFQQKNAKSRIKAILVTLEPFNYNSLFVNKIQNTYIDKNLKFEESMYLTKLLAFNKKNDETHLNYYSLRLNHGEIYFKLF